MRTLFVDFASHRQLIALVDEKRTISQQPIDGKSESVLIPTIEQLIGQSMVNGQRSSVIDRIAAVTGPGGFMSLRVGISLANALSDGLKIPLAGMHLSDLWKARLPPPSSPSPFSRGEKGEPVDMGNAEEKKAMNPMILKFARALRKKSTESEEILWQALRGSQLGSKFRRQHPIQHRILDFYCHESRLGIEIDGSVHDNPDQVVYDRYRTEALTDLGIHIIRFRNEEVLQNVPKVLARIQGLLRSPLPAGEGLGVRVVWLHSTKREFLFVRGFGKWEKEWPEPVLISIADVQKILHSNQKPETKNQKPETRNQKPASYVGELIESQRKELSMLREQEDIATIEDVLPKLLNGLRYAKQSLLPWYGRGHRDGG